MTFNYFGIYVNKYMTCITVHIIFINKNIIYTSNYQTINCKLSKVESSIFY